MGLISCAANAAAMLAVAATGPVQQEIQTAPPPEAAQPAVAIDAPSRIPATTVVDIEIMEPLSSRTAQRDAMFPIRVAVPVIVDGRELIPAGATGMGQVIHAAKSGGGGKAGELLLAARYLEVDGVRVPLRRFKLGASGAQKADEAFAVGFVVPFGQLLVKGKEIEFPAGTRANAVVAADTALSGPSSSQKGE